MTRYFEDFEAGDVFELGSHTITKDEIVAFARQFDPQPFHVDEQAARDGPFDGLIASGWHTGALWMRLYVDAVVGDSISMGSPGIEELRWLQPVRPGDTLQGRLTVLETTPSSRRHDRGTVRSRGELFNQDGETVLSLVARGYFGRRRT
jgi:acyl dehydratase